jgi:hypothetical protein
LCGSELSRVKLREIQQKLRDEEQNRSAKLAEVELATRRRVELQLKKEFEEQKQAGEKKVKDEAEQRFRKIAAERDLTAKKLKESEQREIEARKQVKLELETQKQAAEKKAKAEAAEQIRKANADRDQLAKKLNEAQAREAQVQKTKEAAEAQRQKDLMEQRQAFEKDKKLALLKQQSDFSRQNESLQKKIHVMENQLQKKTANELGDAAEIDLFESLRDAFQGDKIYRIQKGQAGADIRHEVLYKGVRCGTIITDAKNRQGWQNGFITKLRQDQIDAGAEHAILATTVFPAGQKGIYIEAGIIVVSPAHVVYITHLLRQFMLTMHIKGLSLKERSSKMTSLYKLITSESYSKKFAEATRLTEDLLELDVQEKKAHDLTWRKRGTFASRIKHVLREVETDVAAVIEGIDEDEEHLPAIEVKSVSSGASNPETIERIAWNKH